MENLIGKIVQNYKIVSVLGKGGMGIVYKAYDVKLDRFVAIKMLSPAIVDKSKLIERFKREAKHQAQLSHPNVVAVYGFIDYMNLLGIVMEYVEGESLDKLIERKKRLHLYDAVYILRQILLGIGYAHSKGFVHRDIKPSNIIMNREGVAKITDFGISKSLFDDSFTKTGAKVGTIYYMSPEQIKGKELTHHSDIYSIGCTIYEMVTGWPPFFSENEYEVMESHLKKNPISISNKLRGIPDLLNKIISTSMAKNPNNRYDTCEEFLAEVLELDTYLSTQNARYYRKKKRDPKKVKVYSILAFSGFIIFMLVLSYFIYNQVHTLLESQQLESLKKYSIETLFEDKENSVNFSKMELIKSGVVESINSIHFVDDSYGVALCDSGIVLTSRDSGKTWIQYDSVTNYNLYDSYFLSNGKSYIVGGGSQFFYCENYLNSWQSLHLADDYTLLRVDFINQLTGFVLGNKGFILRTSDGGTNWRRVLSNTDNLLYDFKFINDNIGFIVGWKGTLLKTTDAGITWNSVELATRKYLRSIDFLNDDVGLIVGGAGTIYRTDNGGEKWDEIKIGGLIGLQKVKFLSDDYVIAIGSKGTILFSDDTGRTWDAIDSKVYAQLMDLTITPSGNVFIVGTNGTILKLF